MDHIRKRSVFVVITDKGGVELVRPDSFQISGNLARFTRIDGVPIETDRDAISYARSFYEADIPWLEGPNGTRHVFEDVFDEGATYRDLCSEDENPRVRNQAAYRVSKLCAENPGATKKFVRNRLSKEQRPYLNEFWEAQS